jgi:hypothetical protein
MQPDPTVKLDEPAGAWAQRFVGAALLAAVGMVLWQAGIGITDFWSSGTTENPHLGFWLFWVAESPLLLYMGMGLLVGRFRQRNLFSAKALIACGGVLLLASATLTGVMIWQMGIRSIGQSGAVGGMVIGGAAIAIGVRRHRDSHSRAERPGT